MTSTAGTDPRTLVRADGVRREIYRDPGVFALEMEHLLDRYGNDHRHAGHRWLMGCCVLLIVWSAIVLVWTIPVPPMLGRPGFWAVMLACWM